MARQEAPFGSRTSTEQMTESVAQVAQFYETEGDRNAAFGAEEIPTGLITHLGDPPSEVLRWARHDGGQWIGAFLPPTINCGWVSNLVVADRTKAATLTAVVRLNEPVPAGETYSVQYKTTDGTATAAEGDFTAIPLTTLTFAEGEREKQVMVTVPAKTGQPVEEFYLDLSNPSEGSTTFGIGGRLTIDLTGDTSPLFLVLSDTTVDEGNAATITATINREATGAFTFTWSTRQQASPTNRAPASVYTAVASASATIPEGSTSVNLVTQTVEVNAAVQLRNQNYEVVVPQSSLMVAGGDTIAPGGHDLVGAVTVIRNQYVAPTNTITSLTQSISINVSNADRQLANWPTFDVNADWSQGNTLAGAHFYATVSGLYFTDTTTTQSFLLQPREFIIYIPVSFSILNQLFNFPLIISDQDGTDPFYSKPLYTGISRDTTRTATVVYDRPSGIRLPGGVSSLTRTF